MIPIVLIGKLLNHLPAFLPTHGASDGSMSSGLHACLI